MGTAIMILPRQYFVQQNQQVGEKNLDPGKQLNKGES
jgi:hypothetical protein